MRFALSQWERLPLLYGVSDLDEIDWYAYIDAFGFKEMSILTSPSSNLNTMMNNYLGIEELKRSDWYRKYDPDSETECIFCSACG